MTDVEERLALGDPALLAKVLRSRGKNNSLNDIERAADMLERLSVSSDPGWAQGFDAIDEVAWKGCPSRFRSDLKFAIAALPAPATVSDSNKSVTEDELRTWLYQQFSKPTPLCDALLATYTMTKKEAGL